jgi:hypothetical protein
VDSETSFKVERANNRGPAQSFFVDCGVDSADFLLL